MKKALLLFMGIFFVYGCGPKYGIIKETQPGEDLKKYRAVSVGWLDLGPERWKTYDYESQAQWVETINHVNRNAMPDYFKKALSKKEVSFAASRNDAPKKDGLVIRFSEVEYVQRTSSAAKVMWGTFAGSDTLDMTMHFIDGKTGKELNQMRISVYSKSTSDISGWGFEGRINNCVYNLAYIIADKVQ
ncbi:MAG: DUF4410 domain-containing protein [Spirochaetes bacterium]|nr:DUF4410 domain-containing protein [Spirochaetota bacterium]